MPSNFAQVGRDLSGAVDFYVQEKEKNRKKKLFQDFANRQLAALPQQGAPAPAGAMPPPTAGTAPGPMPPDDVGSLLQPGGTSPQLSPYIAAPAMGPALPQPGAEMVTPGAQDPAADIGGLLQPGAAAPQAGADADVDALRMLLEGSRDELLEPKDLFGYIGGIGKQDKVQEGRREIEGMRRDMMMDKMAAMLEQIQARLSGQKEIVGLQGENQKQVAGINADSRETVADKTGKSRVEAAAVGAKSRAAGKPADPATLSDEELEAELQVYGTKADSLNTAGMLPDDIGYKPAEETQFRLDEGARQKDLSKTGERVTTLKAEKAKRGVRGGVTPAASGQITSLSSDQEIERELTRRGQRATPANIAKVRENLKGMGQ